MRRYLLPAALAMAFMAGGAHAQLMDNVKNQLGGKSGGNNVSTPSLGGSLPLSSLSSNSAGNAAGVIEFCIKNNYLEGGDAQAVKDKLIGKVTGGSGKAESDSGYNSGVKGILTGSDGKSLDLSGGDVKKEITKKACDQVLKQGKSFL